MNTEVDSLLVYKVKTYNDENALQELICRHSGIYMDMIRRYGGKSLNPDQISDMINEKDYHIYKAALEYDETRSKFSTFLGLKAKYLCLTGKTNNQKQSKFVNFEEVAFNQESNDFNPSECSERKEFLKKIFELIENNKDDRVKKIFKERYFAGDGYKLTPWKNIAKKINVSIQGCIDIHNKAIIDFRKKIQNEQINI
jgi:DNA-directed RNA polymerase specialized sigma subunit